jgi:hypothetical protein
MSTNNLLICQMAATGVQTGARKKAINIILVKQKITDNKCANYDNGIG